MRSEALRIAMVSGVREMEMAETDDSALVRQALDGRIESFKKLVDRYHRRAFLFARGMVGNADDAYDLSQEAFVRAYRHLKRFDAAYSFRTWFYHILANLCKNHLRKRKNRADALTMTGEMDLATAPVTERPDTVLEQAELARAVWEAVEALPEKFKEIVILSHFEEMSYREISRTLGIPGGSVMSRLFYARVKLREILEKRGVSL